MILKCLCNNCPGHIEFDEKDAGQTVVCPHCGLETLLFIPQKAPQTNATQPVTGPFMPIPPVQPAPERQPIHSASLNKCPSCNSDVSVHAAACPKCGHQFKYAGGINLKDPVHVIGLGICALIIIGVIYYILSIARGESAAKAQEEAQTAASKQMMDETHKARKAVEELDEALQTNR
jgi:uncharacterized paraquat-inducible protein A